MNSCRNQPSYVGHIYHEHSPHRISDLAEAREVDDTRIRTGTRDDQLGMLRQGQLGYLVIVDGLGVLPNAIGDDVKQLADQRHRASVAQMSTIGKRHAQDRVSWLQNGEVDLEVGLRSRVGLDVCSLRTKERFGTLNCQRLDDINKLTTTIVAFARVSLGVLVCQD